MPESKVKWTESKVLEVIAEARRAGAVAAAAKLEELQAAGPKYTVHNGGLQHGWGPAIGTMLDVCGFASMRISARGKFFQLAKKIAQGYRFYCTNAYGGGGHLSIFDSTNRQEMSVNKAAADAHAEVLAKYGIQASVRTRID
jgi:hypothetical protein